MSTFTAVGPALNIDGPLPEPPQYRLLALPGVLRELDEHALSGVNVWGFPEGLPFLMDPCATGTYRDKEADSDWQQPRFDSFTAYFPITCSTITAAPEVFAQRAEAALTATISAAVEHALSQGITGSTNPFFGDTNMTALAGGAAVAPRIGLSYLENAIGATGTQGMIHATPGIIAAWTFLSVETDEPAEDYIETVNGTPVASEDGLIGADPVSGTSPSAGKEWAFATGPVSVFIVDGPVLERSQYIDRSENVITYRAEKYVLATWDTSLQAGVLIDWTL